MPKRTYNLKRETRETFINISLNVDGQGEYKVETGLPFLNHMLELLAGHGLFDLEIEARGDLEVDPHHTVEDIGISLGQVFRRSLGDKKQIRRYGYSLVPMDESLAMVALDFSGRPYLEYEVELPKEKVGSFDAMLTHEFFHAFVNHAAITMHVKLFWGRNTHHMIEAIFKALAIALDEATSIDERRRGVPSTKGEL